MFENNMFCGRKLEFGDAEQIYFLKLIDKSTMRFLEKKKDICDDDDMSTDEHIEDCITCPWPCKEFKALEKWINKLKKGDLL